jgi:hypothetical protein
MVYPPCMKEFKHIAKVKASLLSCSPRTMIVSSENLQMHSEHDAGMYMYIPNHYFHNCYGPVFEKQ